MTQQIYFSKYHGLGNDFIVIDAISQRIDVQLVQKKRPLYVIAILELERMGFYYY